ncbi:NADP-dependent oxidoreductase [Gracilibacillus kekensis]|uniref:NADPH:quinone reductase n=1 Tax=Gracilibacillus kekensis TaxID=1027249 RepID=A0A1M7QA34_9BACI|nr:NADP-dependent oxidoreductase [Gracilibacillus kekensis]SHN27565.1 NADPH:quinone reductase [Gracilibacillus kekensis]
MKAIVIEQYGGKEQLKMQELEKPTPGENQVVVKLHATSINPIDWKLREGYLQEMLPFEFPIVLGWDAAGVVDAVGDGVEEFKVGDRVFARPDTTNRGTYAEYTLVDENLLAPIPDNISFEEAAAVPLTALTAYQCLFDFGDVKKGDKVLLHAGAGGVGTFAIQLAKHKGAYVSTTASTKNIDFLLSLGADEVIDYTKQDFEDELKDYDFVLDALGGDILDKSFHVVRDGGTIASIAGQPNQEKAKQKNIKADFIWLVPRGDRLKELADLLEQNKLSVTIGHRFPLSEAGVKQAHALSESHHAKGKIVITID